MKLALIDDDGNIVDVIDNVQDYNLDKSMARQSLMDEIANMIKKYHEGNIHVNPDDQRY